MDMLSCNLSRMSSIPLYEQLYEYIKTEIIEGRLPFETKLPSKRKLADFLQISQNTVETAYTQLSAEGYLEVIPRKGYYVMAYENLEYIPKTEVPKRKIPKKQTVTYHFHPGQIDTLHFPFEAWRKIAKKFYTIDQHKLLLHGNSKGEYELRKEISQYLYHARGVVCEPEQVIIGAGIEILLQQLFILLGTETTYGVEDPGYHVINRLLQTYPKEVFPLAVDEEGLIVDELERSPIDVAYVTPSHHFPYGTILSVNRRRKLLNWSMEAANRYIIEDDYDSEFRYIGKSIPSLQSMDVSGKVIYMSSFSKSLMPSIRVSYMVLPKDLLYRYDTELTFYHSTVSRIDQHILAEFMKQGKFEKHLNRMRKVYRHKHDVVTTMLKNAADKITIIGENSGLHVVLVVENGMSEKELVNAAAKASIKVEPLSAYMLNRSEKTKPTIVLGFAGIPSDELSGALQLLLQAWGIKG